MRAKRPCSISGGGGSSSKGKEAEHGALEEKTVETDEDKKEAKEDAKRLGKEKINEILEEDGERLGRGAATWIGWQLGAYLIDTLIELIWEEAGRPRRNAS